MEPITKTELALINSLSSRSYSNNRLLTHATTTEAEQLTAIKGKLKSLADYFSQKYSQSYGPFEVSVTTGNPIAIGGRNFKRVWSGIFKGAPNKQYAAQISFVMNPREACLDVGFYFGRASGHSLTPTARVALEGTLNSLGVSLSDALNRETALKHRYDSLFDFGFTAYSHGDVCLADDWLNSIRMNTRSSQIIAKIHPNDFDIIENSTIDAYVSQIIFLMATIGAVNIPPSPITIKPLTLEQRAKQAERLAQIGLQGELYVMERERERLIRSNLTRPSYPRHVALESMHYGYDILSLDESGNDVYIEVKTTTRPREDASSRRFYISTNEYSTYSSNRSIYKLYRVYSIENTPSYDELDLTTLTPQSDGYIIEY